VDKRRSIVDAANPRCSIDIRYSSICARVAELVLSLKPGDLVAWPVVLLERPVGS
jgi:hypothetical protein